MRGTHRRLGPLGYGEMLTAPPYLPGNVGRGAGEGRCWHPRKDGLAVSGADAGGGN